LGSFKADNYEFYNKNRRNLFTIKFELLKMNKNVLRIIISLNRLNFSFAKGKYYE